MKYHYENYPKYLTVLNPHHEDPASSLRARRIHGAGALPISGRASKARLLGRPRKVDSEAMAGFSIVIWFDF
jgi:hypothetical protein